MSGGRGSILVVKLSSIGDVVQSLPVAQALRRRFPRAYIAWAVEPAAADIVADNPHLSETLVVGGPRRNGSTVASLPPLRAPAKLRRALRKKAFDLSLDLQGLLKSGLIALLSGAKERIGFRKLQEGTFLFNNRPVIADRPGVHAVDTYLAFAKAAGAEGQGVRFDIAIGQADRAAVDELLDGEENLAALIPGARWDSKRWPAERFAALADRLAVEHGLTGVVMGGSGDRWLAEQIQGRAQSRVLSLVGGTTLKQAGEVFRRCRVTVGNDTGPLYISAAMGTPTVAVFGPTDPRRLGPYGDGHAKVTPGVSCAPCRNRRCRSLKCMHAISVDRVAEAVSDLLPED
jgi:lipopolysaccharide heptosyltransferase I